MKKMKLMDVGYKRYNEFNLIIIGVSLIVIFLPLIVYLVRLIWPNVIRCPYYELTSNPCPFCGVTSDIRNILKGKLFEDKYNIISIPILIIALLEFVGRVTLFRNKSKVESIDFRMNIVKVDFIYHGIIFILILIYILSFFIFDLRRF